MSDDNTTIQMLYAAKKLLQEHGYRVIDPPCPECKGAGVVYKTHGGEAFIDGTGRLNGSGGMSAGRCPRGCQPPQLFNSNARGPITDARARSTRTHDL